MTRVSRKRAPNEGFTLLEMMIVVVLIAAAAALASPAVQQATANRKAHRAAVDIVRLARRARSEAVAYGRAHLLAWAPANGGAWTVWRGINGRCNGNNWAALQAGPACGVANSMCVERISMDDGRYSAGTHATRLQWDVASASPTDLCYEPTGALFYRLAAGRFSDRNVDGGGGTLGGGFEMRIDRLTGGIEMGVPRFVVFPLGADARIHNRVVP